MRLIDAGIGAEVEGGEKLHGVIAEVRDDGDEAGADPAFVFDGDARGGDFAVGDGEIVARGIVDVVGVGQGGVGAGLLIDVGHADNGFKDGVAVEALVVAEVGALAIVAGPVSPTVGVGGVEVQLDAAALAEGSAGAAEKAPRAKGAELAVEAGARGAGGCVREDVNDTANGIGAMERGAGATDDFDAAGHGDVYLVEGVVVEEAGGANRNAVFEEEVKRAGGEGLADGGGVAFAVGDGDRDTGNLA